MSWKNIKEEYRIGHTVIVNNKGVCIGSPMVHDLIVINLDGEITKRRDGSPNEDIIRYMKEMDADPEKLKRLVKAEDTFAKSIAVYTFDDGKIIEKQCEELGWPNVTHDGEVMCENTFSIDREKVVQWAIEDASLGVKWTKEALESKRDDLRIAAERHNKAITIKALADNLNQPN